MTDAKPKQPMQADGAGGSAHAPDGVNDRGEKSQGSSQGGAYDNPHSGKAPDGFDGGQTLKDYHGPTQLGDDTPIGNDASRD